MPKGRGELILLENGGTSLEVYLKNRQCGAGELLGIVRQYFEGVGFLHEIGIQHNDLKLSNVTVDPSGHVFIIDFGLATCRRKRHYSGSGRDSLLSGRFMGTEGWTAPEV